MKKLILIITALFMTVMSYSQKRELRQASKQIKEGSFVEAKNTLQTIEGSIATADDDEKAEYYLYKGQAYMGSGSNSDKDFITAVESFKKVIEIEGSGKQNYTKVAKQEIQNLVVSLVNSAIDDQNAERYDAASDKLYSSYTLSKRDTVFLFYAAGNALNAKNYDRALKYYEELVELGFTGIEKEYIATNKETGEAEVFSSKEERDFMVLSGDYIRPIEKLAESKRPFILRDLSAIYVDMGDVEKAKKMIANAKKESPDDILLLRAEANLALQLDDMKTYNTLMQKVVNSDPDNPELFYNLGVSSASIGETEKAIEYYKKALELEPDYSNAKVNMAVLILEQEDPIIEEMNSLGTSAADNKRYDELRNKRQAMYKEALPYLESALQSQPDNINIARTLMNIYSITGEDAKFKEMKDKVESLEDN
ncbi:MAG: tetratricopeptide repeat protein [Flavobacteriaceae bacterium]